jgi:hypothetical protein
MVPKSRQCPVILGGVLAIVIVIGPQVREVTACRGRQIFKGDKNPDPDFLLRGSKAVGSMRKILRHAKEPEIYEERYL